MVKVFENAVNDDTLSFLRSEFDHLIETKKFEDLTYYIEHKETIKEVFGKTDEKLLQQERLRINHLQVSDLCRDIFSKCVSKNIPNQESIFFCRAHNPIGLHVDVTYSMEKGQTLILPLTFHEKICTIIFDVETDLAGVDKLIANQVENESSIPRLHLSSKKYDFSHCWLSTKNIVDCLPLDGIAPWSKGSVIKFKRAQVHASTNFHKFVPYKDYILIHTTIEE